MRFPSTLLHHPYRSKAAIDQLGGVNRWLGGQGGPREEEGEEEEEANAHVTGG